MHHRLFALCAVLVFLSAHQAQAATVAISAGGIPLDSPWKAKVYALAHEKFIHPAWGWQHSERNYLLGIRLAKGDGLTIDTDVLFAASFLHDMSAFLPCPGAKMEHGDCAAQQAGATLRAAGFPPNKIPAVQAAEHGHMYYTDPGTSPEAVVLHDADSLDFLGDIGAARMLSLTGSTSPSFAPALESLRKFLRDIPPKLLTKTGKAIGVSRAAELKQFLDALDAER